MWPSLLLSGTRGAAAMRCTPARTGSALGEVDEAGDHAHIRRLRHGGKRSEFGPHCGPLDPTNDDVFYNHRIVFALQPKGDRISGAEGNPLLRHTEADATCGQ